MSIMKTSKSLSFLIAAFISVSFLTGGAFAQSSGYSGLVSPQKEKPSKAPQQPSGYSGLIPGSSAGSTDGGSAPSSLPYQSTSPNQSLPGASSYPSKFKAVDYDRPQQSGPVSGIRPIKSPDDIRFLAAIKAPVDGDAMKKLLSLVDIKLPKKITDTLAKPRKKNKDGLWPQEQATKMSIEQLFTLLNSKTLPPEEKEKTTQAVHKKLKQMQESLYIRSETPDIIYQSLGLPDNYVREERESLKGSIQMVEKALDLLEKRK